MAREDSEKGRRQEMRSGRSGSMGRGGSFKGFGFLS